MKAVSLLAALGAIILSTSPVCAASDFGGNFANKGHPAFNDPAIVGDIGAKLQEIAPASGPAPEKNLDEESIGDAEAELGEKFNTDVTRSVIERSTGDVNTRDRMGDGQLGIFMDNSKDERSMEERDVIGVDLKLLEFK